jgi:5'(3')-deoxyribonucleotidase
MTKRILVDVDVTICDSDRWWYQWLLSRYPLKASVLGEEKLPYNLSTLFDLPEGDTGLEFWEDVHLYDDKQPRKDARKYIKRLAEEGNEIMFVSHVSYGHHTASKIRFLSGWFPYNIGMVFTYQKYLIQGHVLVDDSAAQCKTYKMFNPNSQVIKYRDDYIESTVIEITDHISTKYSWEDIYKSITELR